MVAHSIHQTDQDCYVSSKPLTKNKYKIKSNSQKHNMLMLNCSFLTIISIEINIFHCSKTIRMPELSYIRNKNNDLCNLIKPSILRTEFVNFKQIHRKAWIRLRTNFAFLNLIYLPRSNTQAFMSIIISYFVNSFVKAFFNSVSFHHLTRGVTKNSHTTETETEILLCSKCCYVNDSWFCFSFGFCSLWHHGFVKKKI